MERCGVAEDVDRRLVPPESDLTVGAARDAIGLGDLDTLGERVEHDVDLVGCHEYVEIDVDRGTRPRGAPRERQRSAERVRNGGLCEVLVERNDPIDEIHRPNTG